MEINTQKEGKKVTFALDGKLDVLAAREFNNVVEAEIKDADEVVFDFEKLTYIASAGLRVILATQKIMNKKGTMVVRNVCPAVMDVLAVSHFTDFITIE